MFRGIQEESRDKIWIITIFVLALALRIIYLFQMKSSPHFFSPTMDPLFHDTWAQNIADGNWIGSKVFFRAPFYAYFLALVYKIFGHSYLIPRLIQHLIGSVSCVLVYLLARRLFGRTVAIVSGLIAATYGILFYFEGEFLLDSFLVFFDLILILLLLKAKDKPKLSRWFVCGLVVGLSAITRPNILFFIPFVWLWIFLVFRKKMPFRTTGTYWVSFLLGAILVILPVTLRNFVVEKDLVLISSQGGINFYIGNNENADGVSAIFYHEHWQYRDFQSEAEKEAGRSLKPSEISRFYYLKGMDFFLKKPYQAVSLLVKKLYLFWSRLEISNNQDIYFYRRYSSLIRILPFGFWFIGPLGLLGIILTFLHAGHNKESHGERFPEQKTEIGLTVLFVLSYMITVAMFFVPSRFRLPTVPFLIVFSAFSLVWLIQRVIRKDVSSVRLGLMLLLPLVVLTNSNAYHLKVKDFSQAHFSLGNVHLRDGRLDLALVHFDSALAMDPGFARAHLNKGMTFFRKGEYEKAEMEFLTESKLFPNEAKAYNNLAAIYFEQEEYDQAEKMAQKSLEIDEHSPQSYMNLALAYWKTGKNQEAKDILKQGFSMVESFLEGKELLGEIYQSETKLDSAMRIYQDVISAPSSERDVVYDLEIIASADSPYYPDKKNLKAKAHFNLSTIYIQQGKVRLAETNLLQAISLKSDFAEALANLGILYDHTGRGIEGISFLEKAINFDPQNAVYHYNLGLAYAKVRQLEAAREEFTTSVNLDPSLIEAYQKLILVDSLLNNQNNP